MNINRNLTDLIPPVRLAAEKLLAECREVGHPIIITETLRAFERQQALYDQGRTTPGPIVTHALPGLSWHCWGRSFDFAFAGEKPYSETAPWAAVGAIGEGLGLVWGGRWRGRKRDRCHFELSGWVGLSVRRAAHMGELKEGTQGHEVYELQWYLDVMGYGPGPTDAKFGPHTKDAVQAAQAHHGLQPRDGVARLDLIEALEDERARKAGLKP